MYPLRDKTPKRRPGRRLCVHYNSYLKTLKEDFNNRCGYCGSFNKFFRKSFTIDHFIPQNPQGFKHSLPPNDYYNLVYSCGYCNSSKTNKWPTNDITKHNDGIRGFIDPVDPRYDTLFFRDSAGAIEVISVKDALAGYIRNELSLGRHIHSVLWKLERVDKSIIDIKHRMLRGDLTDLQPLLDELLSEYHSLMSKLFE